MMTKNQKLYPSWYDTATYLKTDYKEYGKTVSGKLGAYLTAKAKAAPDSELARSSLSTADQTTGGKSRRNWFLYSNLPVIAYLCQTTPIDLIRDAAEVDPLYFLHDSEAETPPVLQRRRELTRRMYQALKNLPILATKVETLLHLLTYEKPWIAESYHYVSAAHRMRLFANNLVYYAAWSKTPERTKNDFRAFDLGGFGGLPFRDDLFDGFSKGALTAGNNTDSILALSVYYVLSLRWTLCISEMDSFYQFKHVGNETLFDKFTLLGADEQEIVLSAAERS